ncbi:MAG: hypothetical protein Kow0090_04040 [Myxococcota bacterium]
MPLELGYFSILSALFSFIPVALFGYYLYETTNLYLAGRLLFLFLLAAFGAGVAFFDWTRQFWLAPRIALVIAVDLLALPLSHKNGLFESEDGALFLLLFLLIPRAVVIFELYSKQSRRRVI